LVCSNLQTRLAHAQKGRKEILDSTSIEDNPIKLGAKIENTLITKITRIIFLKSLAKTPKKKRDKMQYPIGVISSYCHILQLNFIIKTLNIINRNIK
jgi:hypothetical protein